MSRDAQTREMLDGLNRAQRLERRCWRNSTAWCATPLPVRRFAESRGNQRERVSLTLWFPHARSLGHFRYHFLIASDITSIPGAGRQRRRSNVISARAITSRRPSGRNLDATVSTSTRIAGLKEELRKGREGFESCRKALRDEKQRRN